METTKAEFDVLYEKLKTCDLVDLDGIMGSLSSSDAQELGDRLEQVAIMLIRKAAYLEAREWDSKDHAGAVKKQNIVAKRVRKALGFSYPQHDIGF